MNVSASSVESKLQAGKPTAGSRRAFCECFSILQRRQTIQGAEETAEVVFVRKVQLVGNLLDLEVAIEEQLHGLLVQTALDVGLRTHAGVASKSHGEGMEACAVRPGQFFNAQIRGQFVFDQLEDNVELRMALEVLADDVIQVRDDRRDPIHDSSLDL